MESRAPAGRRPAPAARQQVSRRYSGTPRVLSACRLVGLSACRSILLPYWLVVRLPCSALQRVRLSAQVRSRTPPTGSGAVSHRSDSRAGCEPRRQSSLSPGTTNHESAACAPPINALGERCALDLAQRPRPGQLSCSVERDTCVAVLLPVCPAIRLCGCAPGVTPAPARTFVPALDLELGGAGQASRRRARSRGTARERRSSGPGATVASAETGDPRTRGNGPATSGLRPTAPRSDRAFVLLYACAAVLVYACLLLCCAVALRCRRPNSLRRRLVAATPSPAGLHARGRGPAPRSPSAGPRPHRRRGGISTALADQISLLSARLPLCTSVRLPYCPIARARARVRPILVVPSGRAPSDRPLASGRSGRCPRPSRRRGATE